jgi:DNA repair protein RadC
MRVGSLGDIATTKKGHTMEIYNLDGYSETVPDSTLLKTIFGNSSPSESQLEAVLEYSRRRIAPNNKKISRDYDVVELLGFMRLLDKEHFIILTLNGANEVIKMHQLNTGTVNACMVHPRDVFKKAIEDNACAIILAHNHPSGSLTPSQADIDITERIKKVGECLGIRVLDHVIIGSKGGFNSVING